jgi:hypothetical protein
MFIQMKTPLPISVLLISLALLGSTPASSQSQDVASLRQELAALRAEVARLTARIDQLQGGVARAPLLFFDPNSRNPFNVPDVPDPDGVDVKQYAVTVTSLGGANDENARQWVAGPALAARTTIDGEWVSRWNHTGGPWVPEYTAQVKSIGNRVYILYRDHQGRFLADLRRDGDLLIGRLVGVENPADSNPMVVRIVDLQRLDGAWGTIGRMSGRIDFRRKLQ